MASRSAVQALLVIVLLQWFLFTYVLYLHHDQKEDTRNIPVVQKQVLNEFQKTTFSTSPQYSGVAVTLALRAPKWFHRRYTFMFENVLLHTPQDWAVQVFIRPEWWETEILKLHRGMARILRNRRVILTPLPREFWNMKPKDVMMDAWVWNHMVADRVLLFSGNGVLCAHSISTLNDFEGIDYVGVPWNAYNQQGGDGSTHSLRNRTLVLEAIPHYDKTKGAEHVVLVDALQRLNKETPGRFRLATANETMQFGGASLIMDPHTRTLYKDFEDRGPPLVLSGISSDLPWKVRDALLGICPEYKVIFPSLHDPNCFGASPNAAKCAASICALNQTNKSC